MEIEHDEGGSRRVGERRPRPRKASASVPFPRVHAKPLLEHGPRRAEKALIVVDHEHGNGSGHGYPPPPAAGGR